MHRTGTERRRPAVLLALVIGTMLLALTMQAPPAAAATMNDTLDTQKSLCTAMGGVGNVGVVRNGGDGMVSVTVTCVGGFGDGANCENWPPTTPDGSDVVSECSSRPKKEKPPARVDEGEDAHEAPTGGVEGARATIPSGPAGAGDVTVQPGSAEILPPSEPVVLSVLPGTTVADSTVVLINGCRSMGGQETLDTSLDGSGQLSGSDVTCTGGVLDGLQCANAIDTTTCRWLHGGPLEGTVTVTSVELVTTVPLPTRAEQVDAPVAPTPTPVVVVTEVSAPPTPTVAPPPPTLAPTAVAAEPTVAPPSDPPPPKNDNSVPPGGLEDPIAPEPTPTPVVLT